MSENSKIQWTDDTYNPWRGCTKVSAGCKNCYAEKLITTRLRHVHYAAATADGGKRTSKQFHPTALGPAASGIQFWGKGSPRIRAVDLDEPLRWNAKPWVCDSCGFAKAMPNNPLCGMCGKQGFHRRRVFSLSLGDWLDDEVPIEWLADFLDVVRRCEHLDWLLVTKRPELWQSRIHSARDKCFTGSRPWVQKWLDGDGPDNVMVLTSVEDQAAADTRIPELLKIPGVRRGLSCEPLLGRVDFRDMIDCIDWVIAGGESGPDARICNLDWIRLIVDQCKYAGAPCFVKQLGANPEGVVVLATKGDVMEQWPKDLQIREFYK
jgi:protein gp37